MAGTEHKGYRSEATWIFHLPWTAGAENPMPEIYCVAAWRHLRSAECLSAAAQTDDAGYHLGMAGENAIKHALQESGLERHWIALGTSSGLSTEESLKDTPMRGHLPDLRKLVRRAQAEIALNAVGRIAGSIQAIMLDQSFTDRFAGWHINIRYAHTQNCPVSNASYQQWSDDAEIILLELAM